MKRCPRCRRDYFDETLSFCLDDGVRLVDGAATDEPKTAILGGLGAPPSDGPAQDKDATKVLPATPRPSFDMRLLLAPIVLALIVLVGFFGTRYFYAGKGQIESIAVMPFVNESGNPEVEYLSDGMTESLIASLSQLPNLNVKARSSVFRYKGRDADLRTIGEELGVQAILSGRVVQRGQDLTLYVELVDAQTENSLWKQTYNKTMTNIVALQNGVARDVADKLRLKLSGMDEQKLAKNYTENAEAYQLYLKGRFYWFKRSDKDLQKSAECFRQAIAIDPNYALAYAGLADVYAPTGGAVKRDPIVRREQLTSSREAALKAVSLDDNLAEGHTALGTVLVSADFDFAGAEREYRRAIDLNPRYADAHYWYGVVLNRLGRWEESFAEFQRALELEPFNLIYQTQYGASLAWSRRYDEGIAYLEKTLELDDKFLPSLGSLSIAYSLKGDHARAIELRTREMELSDLAEEAVAARSVYAKGGWDGYLRYITGRPSPVWVSSYEAAVAHVALREKDKAISALTKSCEDREGGAQRLKVDPRLDPLRDDPAFNELLRRVGFIE